MPLESRRQHRSGNLRTATVVAIQGAARPSATPTGLPWKIPGRSWTAGAAPTHQADDPLNPDPHLALGADAQPTERRRAVVATAAKPEHLALGPLLEEHDVVELPRFALRGDLDAAIGVQLRRHRDRLG